ncbi:hypothetical protein O181_014304 [Austropuccinia psidii MF-1]|uniref:Uncharacterized protein n=1 Tax=Austropuccinia psidii MF-1 TaxID=1389203 RepID=A0A9Q3BZV5_9BASI|nr:hypothetical protein [Austropuccinia psidii MF-1]
MVFPNYTSRTTLLSTLCIIFPIQDVCSFELTLPPFVEPYQHNEPPIFTPTPPIPGPSKVPASKVPLTENNSTNEPEPEVALMKSMEEAFGKYKLFFSVTNKPSPLLPQSSAHPNTPWSFIIIDNTPVGSPLHPGAFP